MKFTFSWLKDHLETQATVDDIAAALTDLGLEVEEVIDPAETLGAFRIARVIEAAPHPDADRLRLCRVAVREGPGAEAREVQVVCGAPNARTGMLGVFAPPGTHIPGTGVDLKPGVIRGVESNGMLCSERELMISDDHEGIIDLPGDAPEGVRYIDYAGLNDPVIDIAVTPNRPDALGVRGIARDLAARGLGRLKPLKVAAVAGGFACPRTVTISADAAGDCPHFTLRLIRGVTNGPSPDWLRRRLRAVGLRPISALVDITNFFTIGLNRPLHVFDAAQVSGDLVVHPAAGGERLTALDDKDYELAPGMTLISDDAGVQSIAGVMGGAATGVSAETTDVLLESAWWDPLRIAATGRALKIGSDARFRFERGVDPAFTRPGLEAATAMILELCGGEASGVVEAGAAPDHARSYPFDPAAMRRIVGMEVAEAEQRRILAALGFRLEGGWAHVPSWRPDIRGEADLVEEVARVASLSRLEGRPLPRASAGVPAPVLTQGQRREQSARRAIAAAGYNECVSYSFIAAEAAALFGGGGEATRLENPISSEMTHLRPDLLPGLLAAAARNQARGQGDLALFELGPVFHGGRPGEERPRAAGLRVGHVAPRSPHDERRVADLFDAKADALAVLEALGAPASLQTRRDVAGIWHPGRAARLTLGPKTTLAVFGELHPRVLKAMDVKGPAVAFTLMLDALPERRRRSTARPALELPDLQPVDRDFAFIVDARTEAGALVNAAVGADKGLIESVHVFDEFAGPTAEAQLGAGRKSLALTVRLQPRAKTLTEAGIQGVSEKIIAAVTNATGATLRR